MLKRALIEFFLVSVALLSSSCDRIFEPASRDSFLPELVLMDEEYVNDFDGIIIPSGGYNMKVSDLLKYVQIHLNGLGGNDRFLSREEFEFLHYSQPEYSLCWENGKKYGYKISEHSGSKGNFFCHASIFPELDMGIIFMANSGIVNALKPLEAAAGYRKLEGVLETILRLYLDDEI